MEVTAALGFVVGMRHALEADHVAAVASLAVRGAGSAGTARLGALWGLGHAAAIMVVGGAVLLGGAQLPRSWPLVFESMVGLMLLALGIDALKWRQTDAVGGAPSVPPQRRALLVGIVHGMAGSAALVLLMAGTAQSTMLGLLQLALFGVGSIGGMVLLSLALSLSLRNAAIRALALHRTVVGMVGFVTALLGLCLLWKHTLPAHRASLQPVVSMFG